MKIYSQCAWKVFLIHESESEYISKKIKYKCILFWCKQLNDIFLRVLKKEKQSVDETVLLLI